MSISYAICINSCYKHNINSVDNMPPDVKNLYLFLKDNRTNELKHIDIIDRRIKKFIQLKYQNNIFIKLTKMY